MKILFKITLKSILFILLMAILVTRTSSILPLSRTTTTTPNSVVYSSKLEQELSKLSSLLDLELHRALKSIEALAFVSELIEKEQNGKDSSLFSYGYTNAEVLKLSLFRRGLFVSLNGSQETIIHESVFYSQPDPSLLQWAITTTNGQCICEKMASLFNLKLLRNYNKNGAFCSRVCEVEMFIHFSSFLDEIINTLPLTPFIDEIWFVDCPNKLKVWNLQQNNCHYSDCLKDFQTKNNKYSSTKTQRKLSACGESNEWSLVNGNAIILKQSLANSVRIGSIFAHISVENIQKMIDISIPNNMICAIINKDGNKIASSVNWNEISENSESIISMKSTLLDWTFLISYNPLIENQSSCTISGSGSILIISIAVIFISFSISMLQIHSGIILKLFKNFHSTNRITNLSTQQLITTITITNNSKEEPLKHPKISIPTGLNNWNFDIRSITNNCNNNNNQGGVLTTISEAVLEEKGLIDFFKINRNQLHLFLVELEKGYKQNHYHSAFHAADVTQAMYTLLNSSSTSNESCHFTKIEVFAALFASMSHDFQHPGVSNGFLQATKDPLSIRYNGISVLENMHSSETFSLLFSKKHSSLFSHFTDEQFSEFYSIVVQLILATDMSRHVEITSQFNALIRSGEFQTSNKAHRLMVLKMFIKFADVSNPTRTWPLCYMWSMKVINEFFLQGDREKALGLPISPFNDRETVNIVKSQESFCKFVAVPMAESISKVISASLSSTILLNASHNSQHWKELGFVSISN